MYTSAEKLRSHVAQPAHVMHIAKRPVSAFIRRLEHARVQPVTTGHGVQCCACSSRNPPSIACTCCQSTQYAYVARCLKHCRTTGGLLKRSYCLPQGGLSHETLVHIQDHLQCTLDRHLHACTCAQVYPGATSAGQLLPATRPCGRVFQSTYTIPRGGIETLCAAVEQGSVS